MWHPTDRAVFGYIVLWHNIGRFRRLHFNKPNKNSIGEGIFAYYRNRLFEAFGELGWDKLKILRLSKKIRNDAFDAGIDFSQAEIIENDLRVISFQLGNYNKSNVSAMLPLRRVNPNG